MNEFLTNTTNSYYLNKFWLDYGDERVLSRLSWLKSGPYPLLLIVFAYLVLVLKIIPSYMRNRPAFQLRHTIRFYNILLVVINGFYFFYEVRKLNFGLKLMQDFQIPSTKEFSPELSWELSLAYIYHLTKLLDFADTIFFALRKKNNQITFLHLYHHSLMAVLSWLALWYRFNMQPNRLFILLNSLVHTIMYAYYFLASFGPKVQRYLWWKRYLTQLQLAQFVVFIIYGIVNEILGIPFPNLLKYFTQAQSPIFFYLFYDFYLKSYTKPTRLTD